MTTTTTPAAQAHIDYMGYIIRYGVAEAAIILANYRQAIAAEISAGTMGADDADWEAAYIEAAAGIISARMPAQEAPQEAPATEAEQQPTETENAPQAATQAAEGTDEKKEAETMTTTEREALERINARQNAANHFTNITPADIAAEMAAMEAEQAAPEPDPAPAAEDPEPREWYAVMLDRDDDDWGTGSWDRADAMRQLQRARADGHSAAYIAVITGDVCTAEII